MAGRVSAKNELNVAKAGGGAAAIAKAEAKELLMHRARLKQVWMRDPGLLGHLEKDRGLSR